MKTAKIYHKKKLIGSINTIMIYNGNKDPQVYKAKSYKIEEHEDTKILTFVPVNTTSFGITSKGTLSARTYNPRPKSITVASVEVIEE